MAGNRHGRDPFDDDRTEFIGRDEPTQRAWGRRDGGARGGAGRDDQPTEYIGGAGRDDQPTEYIGGAGRGDQPTEYIGGAGVGHGYGPGEDYDPDADFGGGRGRTGGFGETGQTGRPDEPGQSGTGQYWAPLTPEERGIDPREARDANAGAPYGDARHEDGARRGAYADRDPRAARDYRDDDDDGRRGGAGRSATIIGVTAIIAVVVLVALMFRFLSGGDDGDDKTTATTPPPVPSTSSAEPTTETSDPMRDELNRLRDEVSSLRETPPAIPGFGGGEAVQATVPEAVGKSPAEVELALRRAGFGNITILDAAGNPTNSLASLTGRVATIDPPAGTTAMTDQQITITLE